MTLTNIKLSEAFMPCRKLVLAGWLRCEPAATALDFRDFSLSETEAEMISDLIRKLPKVPPSLDERDSDRARGPLSHALASCSVC